MKARRGTKANPFEVGDRVRLAEWPWRGIVKERTLTGTRAWYLVSHGFGAEAWFDSHCMKAVDATCEDEPREP